ncbi:MAG: hypothetical protein AMJ84_05460 [Acidithiobacillales bacterium SM23_46]|nr:MAG: hypothetical protein AMJ84_05460 [Acidithiobacillales bacterium SM23_46]KPL27969.1 MAG: hypothetical protein AMJ72_05895 [Acidithiobacillales bacterium SM1_46]
MKVKLKTRSASAEGNFAPGTILDLPAHEAKALIAADAAVPVDVDAARPIETATLEPAPETTAELRRRRKSRPRPKESD